MPGAGRFAPSPSGDLHVGNLRTALVAWLFARSSGRAFLVRMEDLDRVRASAAERQLDDLGRLGIDHDGAVEYQSRRTGEYRDAVADLSAHGLTYECFCTRKDIQQAPSAPHTPPGAYPGTCRDLTTSQRQQRRRNRDPAIRLRSTADSWQITDLLHGTVSAAVDDFVIRRGDGTFAYHLACVVDDGRQGIDQIVRGDDLLTSAPRQAYLAWLLGYPPARYAHVPLALAPGGTRLAKRDGAVTRRELIARGVDVLGVIADSLGMRGRTSRELLDDFEPARLPREPWIFTPPA